MIEIRKVSVNDVEFLREISSKTFDETFSVYNTSENMHRYISENFCTNKLTDEINNPDSEFYFAVTENKIIGYIKINFREAQTEIRSAESLELERIYVLKVFHAKGEGKLLFDKTLQIAKENELQYVWLGVWEKNEKAIRIYEKNGFKVFDKHVFVLGNDAQTDLMMKLDLLPRMHE